MKTKTSFEIDGLSDDDDKVPTIEAEGIAELETRNSKIETAERRDPEVVRQYAAWLKDWRWRMHTFNQLSQEYMGHRGARSRAGERCF
jgi:hypothetical protein